jgi:RNA polymerase sigma-70 factor (ECF subfamily)
MTHLMSNRSDLPPPRLSWGRDTIDETVLLARVARGDVPAQELLWRMHLDCVHRVCASQLPLHDAEDAVAETFLAAFGSAGSFDPDRGTVRAWLLGIAVNQVRRRWRSERVLVGALTRLVRRDRASAVDDDHADAVIARMDAASLRSALALLTPADRLVLVTQAAGDLTPAELAQALDTTPGAAKVRLHRARRRLSSLLTDPTDH